MQKNCKLSIVVPCYNEEKNIPLIAKKFSQAINLRNLSKKDLEIILVNNGSQDNSQAVIEEVLSNYKFLKTCKVAVNQGYGFGILSGLKIASGDFIGWTHADMQTDPQDTLRALEIIEKNNYAESLYIKGSRKGRALFDNFFTIGMSIFETILMRTHLWEINAQPNIFHKSFFAKWQNAPHDFSLDLFVYYLAKKMGLKIIRFPVLFPPRVHGTSSWNNSFADKWKFIKRTVRFSLALRDKI